MFAEPTNISSQTYASNPADQPGQQQISKQYFIPSSFEMYKSANSETNSESYHQSQPNQGALARPFNPHTTNNTSGSSYSHAYPSPHQSFGSPLSLMNYKYQLPMTPQSGKDAAFINTSVQPSRDITSHMPQQLSAPADSTTFSTSYLTQPQEAPSSKYQPDAYSFTGQNNNSNNTNDNKGYNHWHGHRSKRSCSHPPDFPHVGASKAS